MALLAEGILKQHWDQSIPVNLAHILKSMGVRLQMHDALDCSARLCMDSDNRATVQLSRQLLNMHQRYAVAHALAHIALHHLRPGMQRALYVGRDFRVDVASPSALEANDFALRLLMPEAAVRYAVSHMRAQCAAELEHVFAVPTLLVQQRLSDLGLQLPADAAAPARRRLRWAQQQPIQDV